MPKHLTCDKCGVEPATEDYEGNIFCEYHRAEHKLPQLLCIEEKQIESLKREQIKLEKLEEEINLLKCIILKKG